MTDTPKPKKKAAPKKKPQKKTQAIKAISKHGRPTKHSKDIDELVYKLCLLGSTDEQMADILEIAVSTFNLWKEKHPSFMESIKRGKVIADADVADSLRQRATGYTHKETKVFNVNGELVPYVVDKHYAPDTTAIAYWLNNRHGSNWKQKQEQVISAGEGVEFNMSFSASSSED